MAIKTGDLISAKEIKEKYKLSEKNKENLEKHKIELENIFNGKDDRKILIIGPCSADFERKSL
ncbi:MAG: hypothetical protein Q9M97_09300 [Candidatus Gracilibacteria bacterium]|nr:hypothetical protein [Candidatus Gracilibacteria bacterium]